MKADLHVHSTASDGTLQPAQLVRLASDSDVTVLAIADHDSVEALPEAGEAARALGITLIPAVELSSVWEGRDVHVLGYFVEWRDETFRGHLADLREARERRARTMVAALAEAGFDVTTESVMTLAAGGAVGRSHVARALVAAGHAESVSDAFKRLIGRGCPYYVAKDCRTPEQAMRIILDAGGLPVIAHPAVSGVEDLVPGLVAKGLRGLEAFHADHDAEQRDRVVALAVHHGLLVTGGTDFHGPHAPNPPLGSTHVPEEAVAALMAAAKP